MNSKEAQEYLDKTLDIEDEEDVFLEDEKSRKPKGKKIKKMKKSYDR